MSSKWIRKSALTKRQKKLRLLLNHPTRVPLLATMPTLLTRLNRKVLMLHKQRSLSSKFPLSFLQTLQPVLLFNKISLDLNKIKASQNRNALQTLIRRMESPRNLAKSASAKGKTKNLKAIRKSKSKNPKAKNRSPARPSAAEARKKKLKSRQLRSKDHGQVVRNPRTNVNRRSAKKKPHLIKRRKHSTRSMSNT